MRQPEQCSSAPAVFAEPGRCSPRSCSPRDAGRRTRASLPRCRDPTAPLNGAGAQLAAIHPGAPGTRFADEVRRRAACRQRQPRPAAAHAPDVGPGRARALLLREARDRGSHDQRQLPDPRPGVPRASPLCRVLPPGRPGGSRVRDDPRDRDRRPLPGRLTARCGGATRV